MLGSRMTTWPDNIFVAIMTTIHGMIMMVAIICPGCHTALKGLKTSSFIHNLTLLHCFFFLRRSPFFAWSAGAILDHPSFHNEIITAQNPALGQSRRSLQSWSRTSWTSLHSKTCNTGRGSLEQRHHRPPWKEGLLIDSWIALHNKGHLLQTKPWKLFNWQVVNSLRSSSRNMLKTCDGNPALCCGQNTQKWTECIKITMRMKRIDKGKRWGDFMGSFSFLQLMPRYWVIFPM